MTTEIGRRQFMSAIGGAAVWYPFAATAQPMPVIGRLFGVSADAAQPTLAAFRKALGEAGYAEGRNVQFEYRWADGDFDRHRWRRAGGFCRQSSDFDYSYRDGRR